MSNYLMELRDEIVPIVLRHLDLVQLSQLRRVCRQCRAGFTACVLFQARGSWSPAA